MRCRARIWWSMGALASPRCTPSACLQAQFQLMEAPYHSLTFSFPHSHLSIVQGEDLLKHGRHGKPKMHYFRLVEGDARLSWRSAKGAIRTVPLHNVQHIRPGQQTDTFKKHLMPAVSPPYLLGSSHWCRKTCKCQFH